MCTHVNGSYQKNKTEFYNREFSIQDLFQSNQLIYLHVFWRFTMHRYYFYSFANTNPIEFRFFLMILAHI